MDRPATTKPAAFLDPPRLDEERLQFPSGLEARYGLRSTEPRSSSEA